MSVTTGNTISPEYLALQQKLHKNPNYGVASIHYAPIVRDVMNGMNATSLSDYGAGKQNLKAALSKLNKTDFEYFPYDPAFPEYGDPQPADLVCCIDVLEHIEPAYLEAVISELAAITRKMGFFSIATGPAIKILADGRNAHLIQKPSSWWLPRLCEYFEIVRLLRDANGFCVLVEPKVT
jgi:hypothetical protein